MPGHVHKSSNWIFRLWTFFVFSCVHCFRIGEAAVPGPVEQQPDSFMDPPTWTLPGIPDFCLGLFNPSGISNKLHMLDYMPQGWWHVAETQASKYQQCAFQGYLRSLSFRSGRNLRSSLGAPAALRPGSSYAGSWTGVLTFGDCPLRAVPCVWPRGEFDCGRVLLTTANIHGLELFAATVYLPPKGPTYPNAVALSESLLEPITAELVLGREGPRAILGDMNCQVGALRSMEIWRAKGWIELQDLMQHLHGIQPRNTCKKATRPDQIWLSPELASLVVNVSVWDFCPDHLALLAGIRVPTARISELQWRLPGHVPWDSVCLDRWNSLPPLGPLFQSNLAHEGCVRLSGVPESPESNGSLSTTKAFQKWSQSFEHAVSQCLAGSVAKADRSFHGRGRLIAPRPRRVNPPVLKPNRPGEFAQASGFLNRAVAAWYKQLRRLQSYCHAVRSPRVEETYQARAALWNSILSAHGFSKGFAQWWLTRPYQQQGAPHAIPRLPPDQVSAQLILEDFHQNYRRFEHWQLQRRKASCNAKLLTTTKSLFTATRKAAKPDLDVLVDTVSQPIQVIDTVNNLVSVPATFSLRAVSHWTLQGLPARVTTVGGQYRVDSDLVLASGQSLTCHHLVTSTEEIHERLIGLWSPRWNRHVDVPDATWDQACSFAEATLPSGHLNLPPITVPVFRRAVHSFKTQAATGPCGWSRADLAHLTDDQVQSVIDCYNAIEQGAPWPKQWSVGLIHCLQKKETSTAVDGFRPITVLSMYYRLFAGIRSGQILAQLSSQADQLQCGFMKGHQAADVWYFIGVCLELAMCQSVPVHGIVADLVKAYNCLPRLPVFKCLEVLGVPRWFLLAWKSHLAVFERYFVVRRCTSSPLKSCTGFPEGCPLACVAMTALDFLWHWAVRTSVPRVLPLSYVDNLELLCDRLGDLFLAADAQTRFCTLLDLEIDLPRLYAWSSTPAGRHELKAKGYKVSLGDRDLGGQVIYCKQLRNSVLTDRISGTLPFFSKLRTAALPPSVKVLNIKQALFPRALHGCEAVIAGTAHFDKLRSGVMKAMRWNRKGASPLVRLGLLHPELDPVWYQLWKVVSMFRQQSKHNQTIRDWWSAFCETEQHAGSHGPFGKLQTELHNIGLVLDGTGKLWFSDNGYVIPCV